MALIAFAANSVLCRLALNIYQIDAGSFTVIRLLSGALVLSVIVYSQRSFTRPYTSKTNHWWSALMLFVYAATFSFAYISLDTATGALILFGSVQITMIAYALFSGNRLNRFECLGICLAFFGFIYLMYPDINTPSATGFLLMGISGITWAIYTIQGKSSQQPLFDTAHNFLKTLPFIAILTLFMLPQIKLNPEGIILAIVSGGIASAIGYAIWYIALAGLRNTQAAVIQLSVPVIAAIGGILFVSETMTLRLLIATLFILGGILIVALSKKTAQ